MAVGRAGATAQEVGRGQGVLAYWVREPLGQLGVKAVIAWRSDEAGRSGPFYRRSYRKRNIVERCISSQKWFRRVARRYEKLALHYLGMLKLGILFRFLGK